MPHLDAEEPRARPYHSNSGLQSKTRRKPLRFRHVVTVRGFIRLGCGGRPRLRSRERDYRSVVRDVNAPLRARFSKSFRRGDLDRPCLCLQIRHKCGRSRVAEPDTSAPILIPRLVPRATKSSNIIVATSALCDPRLLEIGAQCRAG